MRITRSTVILATEVLALLFLIVFPTKISAYYAGEGETWEKYGRNIHYYDFSRIPDNVVEREEVRLPEDLKSYLTYKYNVPRIHDHEKFRADFWSEAAKLGYSKEAFSEMRAEEAVMAAVKIAAARFSYFSVDTDAAFIKKHGAHLSLEEYFHLGMGDCDKYRDATIAAFNIIKRLNPGLRNVYLSNEELGGRGIETMHAWVSVIIATPKFLVLSHIDPTFYDSGQALETHGFHVATGHNAFHARFYYTLGGRLNYLYAYGILADEFPNVDNDAEREEMLRNMCEFAYMLSIYDTRAAIPKIQFVLAEYEGRGFSEHVDRIWYCAYKVYAAAGNKAEKERYRKKLQECCPDSYWTKLLI